MDRALARLPRRDTLMAAILLAVMLAADIAAAVAGMPRHARPAFVIMPGALAMIWICYRLTVARQSGGDPHAVQKLSAFMGRNLSLIASVLTVAHLALLGRFTGFDGLSAEQFVKALMAALGVLLIVMFNRAPKVLASGGGLPGMRFHRLAGWVGVGCGAAIVGVALTAPMGRMAFIILPLSALPAAVNGVVRLMR